MAKDNVMKKGRRIAEKQTGSKKAKRRFMKRGSRNGLPPNLSKAGGFRTYDLSR